ncbi:hypothetical protein GWI33_007754 [Rhynchophorus ferrugineus]|uniref:Uncharacterized protein n=1 Tax=Rhynchophorus ferrugineus TaxID=354439 RepID=A0A834MK40_RHYFE|nr:hypothetical protein GWI33_007754 [Rhynchophorus ferrugineus]
MVVFRLSPRNHGEKTRGCHKTIENRTPDPNIKKNSHIHQKRGTRDPPEKLLRRQGCERLDHIEFPTYFSQVKNHKYKFTTRKMGSGGRTAWDGGGSVEMWERRAFQETGKNKRNPERDLDEKGWREGGEGIVRARTGVVSMVEKYRANFVFVITAEEGITISP